MPFLAVAVLVASCGGSEPIGGRTFEPGIEHLPTPGSFHAEADPRIAEGPLVVRLFGEDGEVGDISDDFAPGDVVSFDRTDLPGSHGLTVNDAVCAGRFVIEPGRQTDVVLRIFAGGCTTTVIGIHDEGAVVHEQFVAYLYGFAPIGTTIFVVSLDGRDPGQPLIVPTDESGAFNAGSLPPGRYRVDARRGDALGPSARVDLEAGEEEIVDFRPAPDPGPT